MGEGREGGREGGRLVPVTDRGPQTACQASHQASQWGGLGQGLNLNLKFVPQSRNVTQSLTPEFQINLMSIGRSLGFLKLTLTRVRVTVRVRVFLHIQRF